MKKVRILLILAAFAWSIPGCTNRNNNNERIDNPDMRDTVNTDTVVTPPLDTANQMPDTSLNGNTSKAHTKSEDN